MPASLSPAQAQEVTPLIAREKIRDVLFRDPRALDRMDKALLLSMSIPTARKSTAVCIVAPRRSSPIW